MPVICPKLVVFFLTSRSFSSTQDLARDRQIFERQTETLLTLISLFACFALPFDRSTIWLCIDMGGAVSAASHLFSKRRRGRIIVIGLDAAGKTTMLYILRQLFPQRTSDIDTTIPTIGMNL